MCYRPGADRPLARTPFAFLVRALPVVVAGSRCGGSCLSPVGPRIGCRVGGTRDIPVEAPFPEGRERFELGFSGWSRVLGVDAVSGTPHCDFADEGGVRVTSWWRRDRLGVTLAGVLLNLGGEVCDKLGSLCQVGPPNGLGKEPWWNARQPGQRTWVSRRERCETPVEDGRHIAYGPRVGSADGCQQVAEWVLSSFGREVD